MKAKRNVVAVTLLFALLISACTSATATQPSTQPAVQLLAPTAAQNLPPTPRPTAMPEPTKAPAIATSQPIDRAASTGPNHFSGSWAGTMSFSDDPKRKEDIQVVIPQGCQLGKACGYLDNITVGCKWEITLTSIKGETLEYTFSKAISGDCPIGSSGTLTMRADGTLWREHKTPDFTASGQLIRQKWPRT